MVTATATTNSNIRIQSAVTKNMEIKILSHKNATEKILSFFRIPLYCNHSRNGLPMKGWYKIFAAHAGELLAKQKIASNKQFVTREVWLTR
jgi:hypothetical protein